VAILPQAQPYRSKVRLVACSFVWAPAVTLGLILAVFRMLGPRTTFAWYFAAGCLVACLATLIYASVVTWRSSLPDRLAGAVLNVVAAGVTLLFLLVVVVGPGK